MDDRSKTCTIMCENMPMCDELNQLLKDEGGYIFGSCDVNMQLVEPIASFEKGEWTCFRGWAYFGYI